MNRFLIPAAEGAVGQGVDNLRHLGVVPVDLGRCSAVVDTLEFGFIGIEPEDEDIILPHLFAYLDIGPVQGADGQGAVQRELHVAGAGGLGAGGGDLLGEIGGRNDQLGLS